MLLSVLIVTYRNPDLTRQCLAAAQQALAGLESEVLVLDNASPDSTAELVREEFPWVHLDASPVNHGFAKANNILARRAQGKYLLLLNPDAILHHGAIDALLLLADRRPDAGIVGGRTLRPDGTLDPGSCWGFQTLWSLACFASGLSRTFKHSRLLDPESLGHWRRDTVRHVDIVTGCLLLTLASTWRQLGGFDEAFWMYGEDQDLAIRAHHAGFRPMITPGAVATHVVGASSASGRKNVMVLASRVRLMRKHWPTWKVRMGTLLLAIGCGIRAIGADPQSGWREGWRRRDEWLSARA